jgi:hypothetical protein
VRDRLVDADRLAELLAGGDMLERELEREPGGAARFERQRGEGAGADLVEDVRAREPAAGLAAADDAQRTRDVGGGEDLSLGRLELVDAVAADDRDPLGGVEVGDERSERERPARRSRCDLGPQVGRAPRRAPPPRGR